jgi:CheY-like chemotaxis protein
MDTNLMAKAVWGAAPRDASVTRVLIVEDNVEASEMLATACRLEGFEAYLAGDGREALEHLTAGMNPDVILLDLHMPVMDGWQFRRAQQERREWADIPVVIISTAPEPSRTTDMAPLAHFGKPIDFDALFEVLRSIPAH